LNKPRHVKEKADQSTMDNAQIFGCFAIPTVIFAVFGYLGYLAKQSLADDTAQPPAPTISQIGGDVIRQECLAAVRKKIKATRGTEFSHSSQPNFVNPLWSWESYFTSKNASGTLLKTNFKCIVSGIDAKHLSVITSISN